MTYCTAGAYQQVLIRAPSVVALPVCCLPLVERWLRPAKQAVVRLPWRCEIERSGEGTSREKGCRCEGIPAAASSPFSIAADRCWLQRSCCCCPVLDPEGHDGSSPTGPVLCARASRLSTTLALTRGLCSGVVQAHEERTLQPGKAPWLRHVALLLPSSHAALAGRRGQGQRRVGLGRKSIKAIGAWEVHNGGTLSKCRPLKRAHAAQTRRPASPPALRQRPARARSTPLLPPSPAVLL